MPPENQPEKSKPSGEELAIITHLGRLNRLVGQGMSPMEAAQQFLKEAAGEESPDEYAERNRRAMEEVEAWILSPEYMAKYEKALSEPDPVKKEAALADLKRENFAKLDMTAFHRTIAARNRQWKAEGILPPDAKI